MVGDGTADTDGRGVAVGAEVGDGVREAPVEGPVVVEGGVTRKVAIGTSRAPSERSAGGRATTMKKKAMTSSPTRPAWTAARWRSRSARTDRSSGAATTGATRRIPQRLDPPSCA